MTNPNAIFAFIVSPLILLYCKLTSKFEKKYEGSGPTNKLETAEQKGISKQYPRPILNDKF